MISLPATFRGGEVLICVVVVAGNGGTLPAVTGELPNMLGGLLITDLGPSMGDIVVATGIGKLFVVSEKFFVLPTRVTPPGMLLTLDFGSRDGTDRDGHYWW